MAPSMSTPAAGWAVRDRISHLAHGDDAALSSATEPETSSAELAEARTRRLPSTRTGSRPATAAFTARGPARLVRPVPRSADRGVPADRVTGPAQDFCLVVTQRRYRDDLVLTAAGPVAAERSASRRPSPVPRPGRPPGLSG